MKPSCLFLLVALLALSTGVRSSFAEGDSTTDVRDPKWRLSVRAYPASSYDLSIGAHRAISPEWELGCQLESSWKDESSDEEREGPIYSNELSISKSSSTDSDLDAMLSLELRRWHVTGPGLNWFMGSEVGFGVGRREYQSASHEEGAYAEENSITREGDSIALRVAITVGTELKLLERLAVAFRIQPLWYDYSWSEGTYKESRTEEEEGVTRTRTSTTTYENGRLNTSLIPQAFLVLKF